MGRRGADLGRPPARLDGLRADGERVSARLTVGGTERILWYACSEAPLELRYEPFLAGVLPFAMRRASSLALPEPVSPRLLSRLPEIQQRLDAWHSLLPIDVRAPTGVPGDLPATAPGRGTAAFFSGGVDSLHTAIAHRDELDALVFVHGFDLALDDARKRARASAGLRRAAERLGLPLVELESNLGSLYEEYPMWGLAYGAGLASVGHLLAGRFERVLISASYSRGHPEPWGSNRDLDPLWSTESLEVAHVGAVGRPEKLAEIARHDGALDELRVCLVPGVEHNCGRCEKCLRTMVDLRALGELERCPVLPHRVPLVRVALYPIPSAARALYAREALELLEREGTDRRLATALRVRLAVGPYRGRWQAWRRRRWKRLRARVPPRPRPSLWGDDGSAAGPRSGREIGRPPARLHSLAIDGDRISATLSYGGRDEVLWHRLPGVPLEPRWEPFLATALPLAMRRASSLAVPGPVSPRLLASLPRIQAFYDRLYHGFLPIDVEAEPAAPGGEPSAAPGRGTAAFFSGGVDSLHTAIAHRDELDALVYIDRFDLMPGYARKRRLVAEHVRDAAAALGMPLVEIETGVLPVSQPHMRWSHHHGAVLAGLAHLLAPRFDRILVAATFSAQRMTPWGSHPDLDSLWSTEAIELVHDGPVPRAEKLAEIDRHGALGLLRVCAQADARRNCGRCEKCVRTMADLRAIGALGRAPTFPDRLPLARLAVTPPGTLDATYPRDTLDHLRASGRRDPLLVLALRLKLSVGTRRYRARSWWRRKLGAGRARASARAAGAAARLRSAAVRWRRT